MVYNKMSVISSENADNSENQMFWFAVHAASVALAGSSIVSVIAYGDSSISFDFPEKTLVWFNSKDSFTKHFVSATGRERGPFGDSLIGYYSPNNMTLKVTADGDKATVTFYYIQIDTENCENYKIWAAKPDYSDEEKEEANRACKSHPSYMVCTDMCKEDDTHKFCYDICDKVPSYEFCKKICERDPFNGFCSKTSVNLLSEDADDAKCTFYIPDKILNIDMPSYYGENPEMINGSTTDSRYIETYVLETLDKDTLITLSDITIRTSYDVLLFNFILCVALPALILLLLLCCNKLRSPQSKTLFLTATGRGIDRRQKAHMEAYPEDYMQEPQPPVANGMTEDEYTEAMMKYIEDKEKYDKAQAEADKRELQYREWMVKHPFQAYRYMATGRVWKPPKK